MPLIDVNEVLTDGFLAATPFDVIRRQEVVDEHGVAVLVPSLIRGAVGAIYPTGDNSLARQAAFETQASTITVVTSFRLRAASRDAGGNSWQPDVVMWQDNPYLVVTANSYTQYGAGMIEAECTATSLMDLPDDFWAAPVVGQMDFSQQRNSGLIGAL